MGDSKGKGMKRGEFPRGWRPMPPASCCQGHWHCKAGFSRKGLIQEGKPASNTPGASQTPAISLSCLPERRETEARCWGDTFLQRHRQAAGPEQGQGKTPSVPAPAPLLRRATTPCFPHRQPGCTLLAPACSGASGMLPPPPSLDLVQHLVWITLSPGHWGPRD